MKLTHEDYGHLTVLWIMGDLTADDVSLFRDTMADLMKNGICDFVLDIRQMYSIDSQGIEALLWLQELSAEKMGQIRLAAVQQDVETILDITRLAVRFEQHPDVDSAIKSLR